MLTSPLEQFRQEREIPNLDGLRAISIFLVLFHHVPQIDLSFLDMLQENGRHGVRLFFSISGFLICTLFLREQRKNGRISLYNFYIRRILRLFPLYYLILLIETFLVLGIHTYSSENIEIFKNKLTSYFFYYSNYVEPATTGPFFIAWSLAAEEQFYLVFGFLIAFFNSVFICILMIVLLLFNFIVTTFYWQELTQSSILENVINYQPAILLGVLLAYLLDQPKGFQFFKKIFCNVYTQITMITILLYLFFFRDLNEENSISFYLYYIISTIFVGTVSLMNPLAILSWGIIKHIGKVSYGIYLMHMLVINTIKRVTMNPYIVFLLGTILVIIIASITYKYFETPFLKLKDKFRNTKLRSDESIL